MIVIGIAGTHGSGKGTVVKILTENGFAHYSATAFIVEKIEEKGLNVDRNNMHAVANELRALSPSYIMDVLYERALARGKDSVIESIYTENEVKALKQKSEFYLIAVDANTKLRYERVKGRKSRKDDVSYEEFLDMQEKESRSEDPDKHNSRRVMELADFRVTNNGEFEVLNSDVLEIVEKIRKN